MNLNKRILGKSGIELTEIGLGLWAAGGSEWGPTDDQHSLNAIDKALDEGVTFFDTADVYGTGHSEELLGKAMQGRREKFIVGTKIGWLGFDDGATAYKTVDQLIAGVEGNLKRLNTDYVDIIQSHISFQDPTMEVFLEGFQKLKASGKVKAYGVSTSDFEYIKAFNADGGCATLQIDYSILNRTAEEEIFPYCQEHGIGVIVRGALAMGLLTGKFSSNSTFPDGDFRQNWISDAEQNAIFKQDLAKVKELESLSGNDRSLAQTALQFVLKHPAVTTVIPGAKNVKQVESNLQTAEVSSLTADEIALIDRVTPVAGGRKIWPA